MSELRDRMIRDMTVRGFAPRTHKSYLTAVVRLAKHYRRSPAQITDDEIQGYLAYLIQERKLSWSTCRVPIIPSDTTSAPRSSSA